MRGSKLFADRRVSISSSSRYCYFWVSSFSYSILFLLIDAISPFDRDRDRDWWDGERSRSGLCVCFFSTSFLIGLFLIGLFLSGLVFFEIGRLLFLLLFLEWERLIAFLLLFDITLIPVSFLLGDGLPLTILLLGVCFFWVISSNIYDWMGSYATSRCGASLNVMLFSSSTVTRFESIIMSIVSRLVCSIVDGLRAPCIAPLLSSVCSWPFFLILLRRRWFSLCSLYSLIFYSRSVIRSWLSLFSFSRAFTIPSRMLLIFWKCPILPWHSSIKTCFSES